MATPDQEQKKEEKDKDIEKLSTDNTDEVQEESETHSNYKIPNTANGSVKHQLSGMYQSWFLDYASYVILERAVPDIADGLKPVQRRILHSMRSLEDGRYNKVANIVGDTMKFHPHGDASIGDALVQLGQKDLLIDWQGNWGNIFTGDRAAAPRYIEARLSKFALDTVFNPKTTAWKSSYDGRNKEPITLPIKFPLLLAQGVEGIAVGLSSKIMPHNFNELIDASIAYLNNEPFCIYPDFQTGGSIDVRNYNDGKRGGSIKVRAKISKQDNKTLLISEIPYGTDTTKLIENISKASEKGKIKIRKIDDNTAANVEILIHLTAGTSSDKTIDALYAFTQCEMNISPNCCVIDGKTPRFIGVSELLRYNTEQTKALLKQELEIQKHEYLEKLFFISLEKIFIENRIYKDQGFEQSTNQEEVIKHIDNRLIPFKKDFIRETTKEDILKLLEIKMVRITKYDSTKADENMMLIEEKIEEITSNLNTIVAYTISWFEELKRKYGKDYPRKTEIRNFETIVATKVVERNEKLYVNYEEGFIGTGLKKDEYVCNCSDLDDAIIFFKDGRYKVVKISEKQFVGKNILYLNVFKKNDKRTIYNVIYRDGRRGANYIKRFAVTGVTRDKEYDLTLSKEGSKVLYFTANHNAEAELVKILLKSKPRLRKLVIETDFGEIGIKGKQAKGNILTKHDIQKISFKQKGGSTLGGRKVWFDNDVLKLNYDSRGRFLGEFNSGESVLVIYKSGIYNTKTFDLTNHFEPDIIRIEKFDDSKVWTVVLFDADQQFTYLKRFQLDQTNKPMNILGDNEKSQLLLITDEPYPRLEVEFGGGDAFRDTQEIDAEEFVGVKSYKARGKRLSNYTVKSVMELEPTRTPIRQEKERDENIAEDTEDEDEDYDDLDELTGQLKLF